MAEQNSITDAEEIRALFLRQAEGESAHDAIRVIPLGSDVAHIFAPTRITLGATDQQAATYQFLINEIALGTTRWVADVGYCSRTGAVIGIVSSTERL